MIANYPAGFGFKLTQSQIKQARTWDGKKDTAINTTEGVIFDHLNIYVFFAFFYDSLKQILPI